MSTEVYLTLITVPVNDGNFIWALKKYSTGKDLLKAHEYLKNHPAGNKTRLRAVNQEIRHRQKECADKLSKLLSGEADHAE